MEDLRHEIELVLARVATLEAQLARTQVTLVQREARIVELKPSRGQATSQESTSSRICLMDGGERNGVRHFALFADSRISRFARLSLRYVFRVPAEIAHES